MAVESSASATWNGDLIGGRGSVRPASGAFAELPLTWRQRAESRESGTSPEELIASAHAGCFAMALSFGLANAATNAFALAFVFLIMVAVLTVRPWGLFGAPEMQ